MKKITLLLLLTITGLRTFAQDAAPKHALLLKVGYGGTYTYLGKDLNGIKDNIRFAADYIYKSKAALSLNYDKPFLYNSFNLKEITLAAKYFPFKWYNQPYIGLSYTSGSYEIDNSYYHKANQSGKHNAAGICAGLHVQFPKNFYLAFDANYIPGKYTGAETANNTLYVNGCIGYKIDFRSK